jgi:hypothetical protein
MKVFATNRCAHTYSVGDLEYELGIPNRVPVTGVNSFELLDKEIERWEARLASLGDDAQLANVERQDIVQKQQQTLQMMSNISKMLYDTDMAIIRKIDRERARSLSVSSAHRKKNVL